MDKVTPLDLPPTLEQVTAYARTNKVRAANNGKIDCGDGRFDGDQTSGSLRAFGGDAGFIEPAVATLEEAGVHATPEQYESAYLAAKAKIFPDAKINVHADSHFSGDPLSGCGYIKHSTTQDPDHDSIFEEHTPVVKSVVNHILRRDEQGQLPLTVNVEDVAREKHSEKAVIFVNSRNYSVNSNDGQKMYFVVDMARSDDYMAQLWPHLLNQLGVDEANVPTLKDYRKWFTRYMVATASILAPGKQIFELDFDDQGNPTVELQPQPVQTLQDFAQSLK